MKFRIELWDETAGRYEDPVFGEGEGDEAEAQALESSWQVTTTGCYRVRPEPALDEPPAYYYVSVGKPQRRKTPCV